MTGEPPFVTVERQGAIAIVTLDDPRNRNAVSMKLRIALLDALRNLCADAQCRAIVLTGAGGHFCSGADVSSLEERRADKPGQLERRVKMGEYTRDIVRLLHAGPKPTVCAVQGYAVGAGLSLVTACDIAMAAPSAKFCAAQIKMGLMPDMGLLWTLKLRVGDSRSRDLILSARTVQAAEALQIGLVACVEPESTLLEKAVERAALLAAQPPLAVAFTKAALATGSDSLEQAFQSETQAQPVLFLSQDHGEAISAFRDKRAGKFKGE